jgi:hypothetical protein
MNKPVQVYMSPREIARLDGWAKARGWTKSQAVRLAVRALTGDAREDPLVRASGMLEGLPRDLSEHVDRYLGETFVVSRKKPPRAR